MAAIVAQLARDERPRERGFERIAILVQRVGSQGRQDIAARELLAQVQDVGARGAERQRAIADRFEIATLAEIQRDGDHLGAVRRLQPADPGRRVDAARVGEHDACHRPAYSSRRLTSSAARRSLRAMTRMVSSPAIVPTTSGSRARSIATASGCD